MTAEWLLSWWNVIFVLPFILAVAYLAVYAATGLTFGGADADGHFDVDADVDLEADAVDGADAPLPDADAGELHAPSSHAAALSWLGVGRVPLSSLLMVLLLTWGAAGFVANQIARGWVTDGWRLALISIPVAAVIAGWTTRGVARAVGRWLPLNETSAGRRHDLLGATGRAIYPITERFGLVSVRAAGGDLYHVPCRLEPGRGEVPKGASVVLTAYTASTKSFFVAPSEAVTPAAPHGSAIAGPPAP